MLLYRTSQKATTNSSDTLLFGKPNECPHCKIVINAETAIHECGGGYYLMFFTCTMDSCRKRYIGLYKASPKKDEVIPLELLFSYPQPVPPEIGSRVAAASSRFVKLYGQAFRAENAGDFDLAVCGYRNALEALIKDYAMRHKGVKPENLNREALAICIKKFVDDLDATAALYWAKEYANNITHYPPDNDSVLDMETFKTFLAVTISHIDSKIAVVQAVEKLPPATVIQKYLLSSIAWVCEQIGKVLDVFGYCNAGIRRRFLWTILPRLPLTVF